MESGPAPIIERLVGLLIPPACREEVLGDLREICRGSTRRYLADALCVIPCVVVSRIRRTADPLVVLMEGVVSYTSFFAAALWLDPRFMYRGETALLELAIPPAILLLTVMIADAYSRPGKGYPFKPILAVLAGTGIALGSPLVPHPVLLWGSVMSALLVSTLRTLFPPLTDRPRSANGPAYWQKLEMVSLDAFGKPVKWIVVAALVALVMSRILRSL